MNEPTKTPGAHWGEIQDFWCEVNKVYRNTHDIPDYPLRKQGDDLLVRKPWCFTHIMFKASPILQGLATKKHFYWNDANVNEGDFEVEERFRVYDRLFKAEVERELQKFYVENPLILRQNETAQPVLCSGWIVRFMNL